MPSSLIGKSGDCWRLRHGAVTMLKCLRTGVRPSSLWIAGFLFPSVGLSFIGLQYVLEVLGNYADIAVVEPLAEKQLLSPWTPSMIVNVTNQIGGPEVLKLFGALSGLIVVLTLTCRLSCALARVADERDWKEAAGTRKAPKLGTAIALSRGLTFETFGLWVCLQCLLFGCFGLAIGPLIFLINTFHLEILQNWLLIPLAPPLVLVFLYASTLGALNQLALQSLVFNRRGPASALAHAWRLVRHDPWAVTRAMIVDLGLQLVAFGWSPTPTTIKYLLLAITGVARACYWARVYTALGGLRAVDGVPGLPAALPPTPPPATQTRTA